MIIIESGQDFHVKTDAAATTTEPLWSLSYVSATGGTYNMASSAEGATTGTTNVSVLTGSASVQKRVMRFVLYNADTVVHIFTLAKDTTKVFFKVTIDPGCTAQYESANGWSIYNNLGLRQTEVITLTEEQSTFETINKNLQAYAGAWSYSSDILASIVYTVPGGTITKTFNYTSGVLTTIVLSGLVPAGVPLTKTFTYTSGVLTSISYS
jgi:hypothetical protein